MLGLKLNHVSKRGHRPNQYPTEYLSIHNGIFRPLLHRSHKGHSNLKRVLTNIVANCRYHCCMPTHSMVGNIHIYIYIITRAIYVTTYIEYVTLIYMGLEWHISHIWGLRCQKQVSQAVTSNYIPQFTLTDAGAPSGLSRTSGELWQDYSRCYMFLIIKGNIF